MKETPGHIIILHKCSKNHDHMLYYSIHEIWCMTDVIVIFHFGLFFALPHPNPPPPPPNSPKNQNLKKMKKTLGDIIILQKCTKNYDWIIHGSWNMARDRRTDRQKKWHIEVGAPPKNIHTYSAAIYLPTSKSFPLK